MRTSSAARSLTPQPALRQPLVQPDEEHNRELIGRVHPLDWVPSSPAGRYDLVVIGGGTAGLVSAVGAAGLGARVAIVERHLLGGDCLNFGCVPSKALIAAGRAAAAVRGAGTFGVKVEGSTTVDFADVMTRMRRLRAGIARHDSASRLAALGVDVFFGEAAFVAPDAVHVGDGRALRFVRAVIASGGRPAVPPIPGLVDVPFVTNETIFSLTDRPRRLIVIGAGPIGCELAQTFRRLGSEVAIVSLDPRLLPRDATAASAVLHDAFDREAIELWLGAEVSRVSQRGGEIEVLFSRMGQTFRVSGDTLLVATGRTPNLETLNLAAAGIEADGDGVTVDDYLRTTNRRVYAAGDVCSRFKFTHAADAMARIALQNAFFYGRKRASRLVIPWCTYTDPEVAHVGIDEWEATLRRPAVASVSVALADVDRAVLDGQTEGFAQVHADATTGRILGATMVSAHAGEAISEIALAMTAGATLGTLAKTVHPYPTRSEVWKKLGDAWNRTRLTPRRRRLLKMVLQWRR